jgi:hypothetical protein
VSALRDGAVRLTGSSAASNIREGHIMHAQFGGGDVIPSGPAEEGRDNEIEASQRGWQINLILHRRVVACAASALAADAEGSVVPHTSVVVGVKLRSLQDQISVNFVVEVQDGVDLATLEIVGHHMRTEVQTSDGREHRKLALHNKSARLEHKDVT